MSLNETERGASTVPQTWGVPTLHKWTCSGCPATCLTDAGQLRADLERVTAELVDWKSMADELALSLVQAGAERDAMREVLKEITALHKPITSGENTGFCASCDMSWPCRTFDATRKATADATEEGKPA